MKIHVTLFGTARLNYPEYDSEKGLVVDLPEGARVQDLLGRLGFSKSQKAMVSIASRIVKADHPLAEGDHVRIFNVMHGG